MIASRLGCRRVDCHALDIATMLHDEGVDLLRQAANAGAAGADWFLTTAPASAATLWCALPIVVRVGPVSIDSPHETRLTLEWRILHSTLPRYGRLALRAIATATGHRPSSELSLFDLSDRRNPMRRAETPRHTHAADNFLGALSRRLELELSITGAR